MLNENVTDINNSTSNKLSVLGEFLKINSQEIFYFIVYKILVNKLKNLEDDKSIRCIKKTNKELEKVRNEIEVILSRINDINLSPELGEIFNKILGSFGYLSTNTKENKSGVLLNYVFNLALEFANRPVSDLIYIESGLYKENDIENNMLNLKFNKVELTAEEKKFLIEEIGNTDKDLYNLRTKEIIVTHGDNLILESISINNSGKEYSTLSENERNKVDPILVLMHANYIFNLIGEEEFNNKKFSNYLIDVLNNCTSLESNYKILIKQIIFGDIDNSLLFGEGYYEKKYSIITGDFSPKFITYLWNLGSEFVPDETASDIIYEQGLIETLSTERLISLYEQGQDYFISTLCSLGNKDFLSILSKMEGVFTFESIENIDKLFDSFFESEDSLINYSSFGHYISFFLNKKPGTTLDKIKSIEDDKLFINSLDKIKMLDNNTYRYSKLKLILWKIRDRDDLIASDKAIEFLNHLSSKNLIVFNSYIKGLEGNESNISKVYDNLFKDKKKIKNIICKLNKSNGNGQKPEYNKILIFFGNNYKNNQKLDKNVVLNLAFIDINYFLNTFKNLYMVETESGEDNSLYKKFIAEFIGKDNDENKNTFSSNLDINYAKSKVNSGKSMTLFAKPFLDYIISSGKLKIKNFGRNSSKGYPIHELNTYMIIRGKLGLGIDNFFNEFCKDNFVPEEVTHSGITVSDLSEEGTNNGNEYTKDTVGNLVKESNNDGNKYTEDDVNQVITTILGSESELGGIDYELLKYFSSNNPVVLYKYIVSNNIDILKYFNESEIETFFTNLKPLSIPIVHNYEEIESASDNKREEFIFRYELKEFILRNYPKAYINLDNKAAETEGGSEEPGWEDGLSKMVGKFFHKDNTFTVPSEKEFKELFDYLFKGDEKFISLYLRYSKLFNKFTKDLVVLRIGILENESIVALYKRLMGYNLNNGEYMYYNSKKQKDIPTYILDLLSSLYETRNLKDLDFEGYCELLNEEEIEATAL